MPLKPYNELVKIDVLPFCEKRKAKDDNGRTVEIPYLNWAMCKQLLHENGAGEVYYTPRMNQEGSYVFQSIPTANKDGRRGGCYFVSVEIHIDDLVFTHDMPLMNGSLVVYEDTVNQLRIANSHARAFVKGVAIRTGLGFGLWVKGDEINQEDDLSGHSIKAIKKLVEERFHPKAVYVCDIYPSCGANIGPGLAAVYYFGEKISEDLAAERTLLDGIIAGL